MSEFTGGAVVSITYLTGRESGGDPFQVLRYSIEHLEESFNDEQKEAWGVLQKEYVTIEDDLYEVVELMYTSEVYELMQPFAPKDHSWGSHPEGCLGFWPDNWDE